MYARILFAWPIDPPYRPLTNEVAEVEPEIVNALSRLIDLTSGGEEDFTPRNIAMSREAVEAFETSGNSSISVKTRWMGASGSGGLRALRMCSVWQERYAISHGRWLTARSRSGSNRNMFRPLYDLSGTTSGRTAELPFGRLG